MAVIIAAGCGKSLLKDEEMVRIPGYVNADKMEAAKTYERLMAFNKTSPETFSSDFQLTFRSDNRGYAFTGRLAYDTEAGGVNLNLKDLVFKSPVASFIQSGSRVAVYLYQEKKLLNTGVSRMNLRRVSDLDIDYEMVQDLANGKIPLIGSHSPAGVLKSGTAGDVIVLKNRKFYERIYFAGNIPRRIELIRKSTGERYIITLSGYTGNGNSRYFRSIGLTALHLDIRIDLKFAGARVNGPVKLMTVDNFPVPPGSKIISF